MFRNYLKTEKNKAVKKILRCCTARGSSAGFSFVSPTMVEARKSFLFTEKFPCIETCIERA